MAAASAQRALAAAQKRIILRVSERESVVFCGAAASPQGWPPPKRLSSFRGFLL